MASPASWRTLTLLALQKCFNAEPESLLAVPLAHFVTAVRRDAQGGRGSVTLEVPDLVLRNLLGTEGRNFVAIVGTPGPYYSQAVADVGGGAPTLYGANSEPLSVEGVEPPGLVRVGGEVQLRPERSAGSEAT